MRKKASRFQFALARLPGVTGKNISKSSGEKLIGGGESEVRRGERRGYLTAADPAEASETH